VPRLARLHAEAMEDGMALGATLGTDLEEMHRRALAEGDRIVVVAELDGEVVGMAHLVPSDAANAPHRAEVQRVAVAAGARGSGVGRRLLAAVEEAALDRGLTLLWLTTHDGTDACAFYESVGYTKLGVMPAYSVRPDGNLAPGAFYFKRLAAD
jgi:GNAT superfamily N-acetyltransferase